MEVADAAVATLFSLLPAWVVAFTVAINLLVLVAVLDLLVCFLLLQLPLVLPVMSGQCTKAVREEEL